MLPGRNQSRDSLVPLQKLENIIMGEVITFQVNALIALGDIQ